MGLETVVYTLILLKLSLNMLCELIGLDPETVFLMSQPNKHMIITREQRVYVNFSLNIIYYLKVDKVILALGFQLAFLDLCMFSSGCWEKQSTTAFVIPPSCLSTGSTDARSSEATCYCKWEETPPLYMQLLWM